MPNEVTVPPDALARLWVIARANGLTWRANALYQTQVLAKLDALIELLVERGVVDGEELENRVQGVTRSLLEEKELTALDPDSLKNVMRRIAHRLPEQNWDELSPEEATDLIAQLDREERERNGL